MTGLCYAELASRFPEASGAVAYVKQGFGSDRAAQVTGIVLTLAVAIAAASIASGAVQYLSLLIGLPPAALIALLVATFTLLAMVGVRESVGFAAVIGAIEILGLSSRPGLASSPRLRSTPRPCWLRASLNGRASWPVPSLRSSLVMKTEHDKIRLEFRNKRRELPTWVSLTNAIRDACIILCFVCTQALLCARPDTVAIV